MRCEEGNNEWCQSLEERLFVFQLRVELLNVACLCVSHFRLRWLMHSVILILAHEVRVKLLRHNPSNRSVWWKIHKRPMIAHKSKHPVGSDMPRAVDGLTTSSQIYQLYHLYLPWFEPPMEPWQHDLLPEPLKEVEPCQDNDLCGSGIGEVWRANSNNSPFGSEMVLLVEICWDIGWTSGTTTLVTFNTKSFLKDIWCRPGPGTSQLLSQAGCISLHKDLDAKPDRNFLLSGRLLNLVLNWSHLNLL